ncbi:MAG TPA: DNA mismatch repair protein MutS [Candidatus Kapabacteria bacterium]|nr:DNA mismatch repair protein MutS [Candidatus Kapabacteria bacterium]
MKEKQTPLMRQYNQIKERYPDSILLFRLGDFYETFNEDAQITAKVCGIALTKRNNGAGADMPLAGFPYHQLDNYLPKLVRAGYRVAVCEQLEDPKLARGIVKRDVVEVVTPGVALYEKVLDAGKNNYVASIYLSQDKKRNNTIGFAAIDVSTGDFFTTEIAFSQLVDLLEGIVPSEIIVAKVQMAFFLETLNKLSFKPSITKLEDWFFDYEFASKLILDTFSTKSLKGFGIDELPDGIISSGAVLHYVKTMQNGNIGHLQCIRHYNPTNYMMLDAATRRNLEITYSFAGTQDGALLKVLDRTSTSVGSRMLKRWVTHPLKAINPINHRLAAVEEFFNKYETSLLLRKKLGETADLERLSAKVATGRANPRDAVAIRSTLKIIPELKEILSEFASPLISEINISLLTLDNLLEILERALLDEPSVNFGNGNIFREGYHSELDDYVNAKFSAKKWISDFQEAERERTGIPSLKVSFNNVFGYYIEITNTHKDKVPADYERKQTLTNAERYTTPILKDFENKILSAEEKIIEIEQRLFAELRLNIYSELPRLQQNAENLATLDCLLSFATVARENNYTRPEIDTSEILEIEDGRHPVVEKMLPTGESFVPNSTKMNTSDNTIHIITGPNMSGKSCYLRQVGLIVLLGQMGSFVPAKRAKFGIVDRIFTRVGAQNNITSGESTFLVEMQEAANIINNATRRSLILLDEVGRGTATFDGISIAWAIAEYIHNEIKAKTLFATHYHELNDMAERYAGIKNYRVEVIEADGNVVFTHKVSSGGSDHSFGIHVAQMAGLPAKIIERANEIMKSFEGAANEPQSEHKPDISRIKTRQKGQSHQQLSIFEFKDDALREKIQSIDVDNITPIEALKILNELKKEIK